MSSVSKRSKSSSSKSKNRMSSELQAIMQRRLAKCEEVPADELMQDEEMAAAQSTKNNGNDTTSTGSSGNGNGRNPIDEKLQNQKQSPGDNKSSHTTYNNVNNSNNNSSKSSSNHTSKVKPFLKSINTNMKSPSLPMPTSAKLRTPSSMSSTSSTSSFYKTVGASFSYDGSVGVSAGENTLGAGTGLGNMSDGMMKNINYTAAAAAAAATTSSSSSPYDEQQISKSPKQFVFAKNIKRTTASGNITTNNNNNRHDDDNETNEALINLKSPASIQQHPYLKRYSPTLPTSTTNTNTTNDDHHVNVPSSKYHFKSIDQSHSMDSIHNNAVVDEQPSTQHTNTSNRNNTISSTTQQLDHSKEKVATQLSSGLSLSHVNAMKKLFTKTNPQHNSNQNRLNHHHQQQQHYKKYSNSPPPPPPPGPPPKVLSSSEYVKSKPSFPRNISETTTHSKESNTNNANGQEAISSSLSSLSKEGIEMTFDNFTSTLHHEVNEDHHEQERNKDEQGNDLRNINNNSKINKELVFESFAKSVFESQPEDNNNNNINNHWSKFAKKNNNNNEVILSGPSDENEEEIFEQKDSPQAEQHTLFESSLNNDMEWSTNFPSSKNSQQDEMKSGDEGNSDVVFEQCFTTMAKDEWDWPTATTTTTSSSSKNNKSNIQKENDNNINNNRFESINFFNNDQITSINKEEEKVLDMGDDHYLSFHEDEFGNEPEINLDCLNNDIVMKSFPILKKPSSCANNHHYSAIAAVKNPLTNNIVVCHQKGDGSSSSKQWYIDEIDPLTSALVASIHISSVDIRHKILSSATNSSTFMKHLKHQIVNGIDDVLNLAIGLHRQQHRTRVRVAALIKLSVLRHKQEQDDGNEDDGSFYVVAIWQWGYASNFSPIMLQYVIPPPPEGCFNAKTLAIADGLLFLSGTTSADNSTNNSNSVLYIAKPHVSNLWVQNHLEMNTEETAAAKVIAMSLTTHSHRSFKVIAIAFDDGRVGVWNYEKAASTNRLASSNENDIQKLHFQCVLEGSSSLDEFEATINIEDDDNDIEEGAAHNVDNVAVSTTQLTWVPVCNKASTSVLLAAAFSNGIAVYCIPVKCDERIHVKPIAIAKTTKTTQQSRISFLSFPHLPPCFIMMFSSISRYHFVYGVMDVQSYACKEEPDHPGGINVICAQHTPITEGLFRGEMHIIEPLISVVTHENGSISGIMPSTKLYSGTQHLLPHPIFHSLNYPVASASCGLTSMGFTNNDIQNDNFINLHSQLYWQPSATGIATPYQRHWFCVTKFGDRKGDRNKIPETDASFATGGAQTEIKGEIKVDTRPYSIHKVFPQRLVRSKNSSCCAILFSLLVGRRNALSEPIPLHSSFYCIMKWDREECVMIDTGKGRDVLFLDEDKYLVLDDNGVTLEQRSIHSTYENGNEVEEKIHFFREGSIYEEHFNCKRVVLLSSNKTLCVAKRKVDGRSLLIFGGEIDLKFGQAECFIKGKMSKIWLREGEEVIAIEELQISEKQEDANIAFLTSSRILIVRCDSLPSIVANYEMSNFASCTSLVALGSHCVAFLESISNTKMMIKYLTCLKDNATGVLSNLPSSHSSFQNIISALRPDRAIYTAIVNEFCQQQECLVKRHRTKPIFVLEPLVCNIIAKYRNSNSLDSSKCQRRDLARLLERFGLFINYNSQHDDEGVGIKGTGITDIILQILKKHGLSDLILNHLKRGKLTTPWITTEAKIDFGGRYEDNLFVLADGDEYMLEYLKNPAKNASCSLPKPFDPLSQILSEYSIGLVGNQNIRDALKVTDLVGGKAAQIDLTSMVLTSKLLHDSPSEDGKMNHKNLGKNCSLALTKALQHVREERRVDGPMNGKRKLSRFSHFIHCNHYPTTRYGSHLINYDVLNTFKSIADEYSPHESFDETNHIWNCGPFGRKEEILLLDRIVEWTGRIRPSILGKEGADIVAESGQRTLQNILAEAAGKKNESENDFEDLQCSSLEGWVEKVGEGHTDEDKLSLYLRFSEGTDEDRSWKDEGFADLSTFQNRAMIMHSDIFELEATTSSIDEGESGSVRLLHDLVFTRDIDNDEVAGLFMEVKRGCSLDIGMFHNEENPYRQRASIEFWFYLPKGGKETILLRRSFCFQNGEDLKSLCCVGAKHGLMWELVAMPSGNLEFRTCGGDVISSTSTSVNDEDEKEANVINEISADNDDNIGLVSLPREDGYGGWNHVSLTFCCREVKKNECKVTLSMRGIGVASSTVNLQLPTPSLEQDCSYDVDDLLSMSALMFGLGASAGFRLTEIRVWAYVRPLADIKRMMYEYLDAAKVKKKRFKVNITGKDKSKRSNGFQSFRKAPNIGKLLAAPPLNESIRPRKPNATTAFFEDSSFAAFSSSMIDQDDALDREVNNEKIFSNDKISIFEAEDTPIDDDANSLNDEEQNDEDSPIYVTVESSLLSDHVRKSAAAAIVRGAPATRHFGGNRGGLREICMNIGSISICGAQKAVVFSCRDSPQGKTYPIGASGAIVSDLMEFDDTSEDNSEFLCCFLAKDKRMVVFELKSKKVIVELQMTTKLNFWRYLPPTANGNNLVFLLITPIGGFHWLPLTESPRPRQVWRRGEELQGKKIVTYEEGGSNGLDHYNQLSSVALILTCNTTGVDPIEAWCMPIQSEEGPFCISSDVQGAALLCTESMMVSKEAFNPLVVVAKMESDEICIELYTLSRNPFKAEFINIQKLLQLSDLGIYEAPTMAMGPSPPVLILCRKEHILVIARDRGLLVSYKYDGSRLSFSFKQLFRGYIVDAGLQSGEVTSAPLQVCLLVSEPDKKDGRIVKLDVQ